MKQVSLLIACILFLQYSIEAQNQILDNAVIACTYELNFQTDSTNVASKEKEFMLLFIGKHGISKFLSRKQHNKDSITNTYKTENKKILLANIKNLAQRIGTMPRSKFNPIVIKNYPFGKQTIINKITRNTYIYNEEKDLLKWDITIHKKTIAGYSCQKALTNYGGRKFEAWFTTSIPISDGPYIFSGLPGLIIKIEDTKKQYSFELVKLVNLNNTPIIYPEKTRNTYQVSKTDYMKTLKRFMTNTVDFYSQEGFSPIDEEHEKKLSQRYKIRNNTIERLD